MREVKGTITRRMDAVLDGLQSEFRTLCTRADLESKLEALIKAGNRSDRASKLRKLFDLLDLCGIPYERGRDNAYYVDLVRRAHVLSFEEAEDRMLLALYARYTEFPTPEEYMERIVDRLCTPEDGWEKDTLRLRILKQFIKYGDYLSAAGYGGRKTIVDYVAEKLGKKPTEEEVLENLDDGVFAGLASATKAQKKTDAKYGLLKTADDLAAGKFRAEGATRKSLYLFAMAYGMTYYSGSENGAEIIDYRTDVETNLFRDYYANNLMRFITEAYRGRLAEYEPDPSGQGINYKNFAEMIYLYYISRDCDPREKLRGSAAMIRRVGERRFKQGEPDTRELGGTEFYRSLFSEDILSLPEEEFEQFICENYDCDTYAGSYETKTGAADRKESEISQQTEQDSAFAEYQAILAAMKRRGVALENCNYGLWFTDVAEFKKRGFERICAGRPEIDEEKFMDFIDLLLGVNSFMGHTPEETESGRSAKQEWTTPSVMKTRALYVSGPETVTRTSMIVAYYYYYNAVHENDGSDKWKSFEEVFMSFKQDLDPKLEAAYYQPLSGKNIFDVLVTFSAYAYLNM